MKYILTFFMLTSYISANDLSSQRGMTNFLGIDTWKRCSNQLSNPLAKSYELSYKRTESMPLSPFAGNYKPKFLPPSSIPNTVQVFTMDVLNKDVNDGNQGTQMDALGHFGHLSKPWDGKSDLDIKEVTFFGGLNGTEVKPYPQSPLLKLGIETVPPIITSALLVDIKKYINNGISMEAGEFVSVTDFKQAIKLSSLANRGIVAGDVILIYTGWSDHYQDPDESKVYYSMAPGISYELAKYLASKKVVAVGLDTPFVDAVPNPKSPVISSKGSPENMVFPIHHYFLTQAGVHTLENFNLKDLASDAVELSCVMILPLMVEGSSASSLRPVAIGVPIS